MCGEVLNLCHANCLMEKKCLFLFTLLIYLLISGEGIFIFDRNNAHHLIGKLVATAQIPRALPLKWLNDVPKWVEQWPLPKVKLEALEQLVEKELQSGYIEPSTPPWNSHFCHLEKIW